LVRQFAPKLPVSGIVAGTATVTGSTGSGLRVVADLDHVDRGEESRVSGKATIALTGAKRFDVDAVAQPVSLVEVGRFAPAAGLRGVASGPVHAHGTLDDLDVTADLRVSGNGRLEGRAHLDLAGTKRYDVAATMHTLNLNAITTKAPATSLT